MRLGRRCRRLVGVVVLLLMVLLPTVAAGRAEESEPPDQLDVERALELIGTNFRISGAAATAHDFSPAVAHNSTNGQYLVVWQDSRLPASSRDIFAQRFTADGRRVGFNFRVATTDDSIGDRKPAVVYNPINNQYLVVWREGPISRRGILYGQRVKANGSLAGTPIRITSHAARVVSFPASAVAHNPVNNQYLVVWADGRDVVAVARDYDLYGQRVKANGDIVGGEIRISDNDADFATEPAVAETAAPHPDCPSDGFRICPRSTRGRYWRWPLWPRPRPAPKRSRSACLVP